MNFSDLIAAAKTYVSKAERGKKLKAKQIKKVLAKLHTLQKQYRKEYSNEKSAKAKAKLRRKRRIIKAQIKKGYKILKAMD